MVDGSLHSNRTCSLEGRPFECAALFSVVVVVVVESWPSSLASKGAYH